MTVFRIQQLSSQFSGAISSSDAQKRKYCDPQVETTDYY